MSALLNDWGAGWAPWFLAAIIQNTVFLLLVFVALRLLQDASARVRTAVATIGVVKLVIPPLVPFHWLMGNATSGPTDTAAALLFPFSEGIAVASAPGGIQALTGGLEPVAVLLLLWASIAASRLGWSLLQTVDLALAVRGAEPVPPDDLPAEVHDRGLEVHLSKRIAMPLTLGVWPRRIYVPTAWSTWSPANRRAVLRHELAHILRHDGLIQSVEIVAQALFFFHPLVAVLIRRLRTWREMACDDLSVAGDAETRLAYSHFLVELAETALGPRPAADSASTLARRKCELMNRVTYQVKEGAMRTVSKTKLSVILAALLLVAVPLSMVYGDAPPAPVAAPEAEGPGDAPKASPPGEKKVKAGHAGKSAAPPPPKAALKLTLSESGILVDGHPAGPEKVKKILTKVARRDGESVIAIDCDGEVPMGLVYDLQKKLRKLELTKVVYTGELGGAVPMAFPPEDAKKKLANLPDDQVMRVKVDCDGVLTVNGKKTAGAKLPKVVASALDESPYLVVALHTERDTRYGAFVKTLQGLKKGGATRIAIQDPEI